MRNHLSRAWLATTLATVVAACGPGMAAGPGTGDPGAPGGRYRVLVSPLQTQGVADAVGTQVANELRSMVAGMATHTAVPDREVRGAMRQHNVTELDQVSARQLAPQINAQGVLVGTVQPGGAGLESEVRYVDVPSGDEIVLQDVTAENPRALAQAIFQRFEASIEGIRLAQFCNDYLASQQWERALETCERALEIVPQSTTALYGKATALYNLATNGAAQQEEAPEDVMTPGQVTTLRSPERMEQAVATYRQVLELDPNHQDALLGAGLAASRLERREDALGYFNRFLEFDPENVAVRTRVAGDIAQAGDFVSAYQVLQPIAAEQADDLEFQLYYARLATAAGQRVQEQQDAAAARPYFQSGLQAFERVIAAQGEELEADVLTQVMAVYQATERPADAIRIGQMATQRFPENVQLQARYGDILRQAGQHQEAIRAYQQVAQRDPQFEGIFVRIALSQMELGQRQQALASLDRAVQAGGDRQQVAQTVFAMASGPLQAGNYAEAERLLDVARGYASGALRNQISFFQGFSIYRQGEAIARANTQGNVQQAQRAIEMFRRAIPLVEGSGHAQAGQVADAARQYIENQEAIIRARRGR